MSAMYVVHLLLTLLAAVSCALAFTRHGLSIAASHYSHDSNPITNEVVAKGEANSGSRCHGLSGRSFSMGPSAKRSLRGNSFSRPCCVSWESGRVDCFIRSRSSTVLHKVTKDFGCTDCSDWEDLGGVAIGEVECFSRKPYYIDIIAAEKGHLLHCKSYSPDGWTDWVNWGLNAIEAASCAVMNGTDVRCVQREVGGYPYTTPYKDGVWGSYSSTDREYAMSPVTCTSRMPSVVDCFSIYYNSYLQTLQFSNGKTGKWNSITGQFLPRKPAVVSSFERIDVFTLGLNNEVMQTTWQGSWNSPVSLGGTFLSPPECVLTLKEDIHCFAIGDGHDLFKNSFYGEGWSGWYRVPGPFFPEAPSCVVSSEHSVSCYARDIYNQIIELDFDV